MKLFDGSENYELGTFSVRDEAHTSSIVYITLIKDTNVKESISEDGQRVVYVGKDYDKPYLKNKINLHLKSLGTFCVHASSEHDNKRILSLAKILENYRGGLVNIELALTSDNVYGEVGLHELSLNATGYENQWSFELISNAG